MGALRAERDRDPAHLDLDACEQAIRTAVLELGAGLLEDLLAQSGCGRRKEPLLDSQGDPMQSTGVHAKTIATLLGKVRLRRSLFVSQNTGETRAPLDEALGVEDTLFSPGVRRFMARAGSRSSFLEASEDLAVYANLEVTPKQVQRVAEVTGRQIEDWIGAESAQAPCPDPPAPELLYVSFDGTGIPVRKAELADSRGKAADGVARTREVKLGCVFTQTRIDERGRPVREEDSTTYVGAIESSTLFGWRIHAEAQRRGASRAARLVVLTDGARYNRTIVETHFPAAIHIIDLYHAREHLCELARGLAADPAELGHWRGLLDMGSTKELLHALRARIAQCPASAEAWESKLPYFEHNAQAMRYGEFRKQGLFVGSGVIEAGCRTLIGQRLKESGMFWSVRGANAIIASRCCQFSGRFEDFWEAVA